MQKICLSSSLKFRGLIEETVRRFREIGITALFPNLNSNSNGRQLCQDHFRAISETGLLYVLSPGGYIGKHVAIEIGYALGKGKPVFFSEVTDIDFLGNVISLNSIERFLLINSKPSYFSRMETVISTIKEYNRSVGSCVLCGTRDMNKHYDLCPFKSLRRSRRGNQTHFGHFRQW